MVNMNFNYWGEREGRERKVERDKVDGGSGFCFQIWRKWNRERKGVSHREIHGYEYYDICTYYINMWVQKNSYPLLVGIYL